MRVFDQLNQVPVEHVELSDIGAYVTVDTDAGCINVPFHLETGPSDGAFNNDLNDFSCDVDMDIDQILSSGFLNESEGIFSSSDENTSETSMVVIQDNANQSSVEESDEADQNIEIGAPRKRRKRADPEKWTRTMNKKKRMKWMPYSGVQVIGGDKENVDRRERHIGPRCESRVCMKSDKRYCPAISENTRKKQFRLFWVDMDWGQKKTYICSLIDVVPTARQRDRNDATNSRRESSFLYHLKHDGMNVQVCQRMFLNTFGLNSRTVHKWVTEAVHGMVKSSDEKKYPERRKPSYSRCTARGARTMDIPKLLDGFCMKYSFQ